MFFQSIYQMITAGTDLNINIRKVDNSLSVAGKPAGKRKRGRTWCRW